MPGFMGIRGLNPQNPHDRERERREENKAGPSAEQERRAQEKVQEILRDQEGDMSAYTGNISDANPSDCGGICDAPVGEIMSAKVAALSFDDNLLTVKGIFDSVKFRHLPIIDEHNQLIGVVSDRDLLRVVSPFFGTINEQKRDKEIMTRKVGTIMTRKPICANIDTTILDAVKLMSNRKISCLPIVKKNSMILLGIVTWKDVVRAFCPRAFNAARDSNRLKSGVKVDPETSESARLRARVKKSTRLFVRPAQPRQDGSGTPAREDEDRAKQESSRRLASSSPEQRRPLRDEETRHISRHQTPQIAASEKLRGGYTAGKAGSELAAKQKALMREQLERNGERGHPPHSKPADDDE